MYEPNAILICKVYIFFVDFNQYFLLLWYLQSSIGHRMKCSNLRTSQIQRLWLWNGAFVDFPATATFKSRCVWLAKLPTFSHSYYANVLQLKNSSWLAIVWGRRLLDTLVSCWLQMAGVLIELLDWIQLAQALRRASDAKASKAVTLWNPWLFIQIHANWERVISTMVIYRFL